MPENDLAAVRLGEVVDGLAAIEATIIRDLERAMKSHPLGPWVKNQKGLGLKQVARLLAAIGDPCWNAAEDRPRRGPPELWAYGGYHVVPAGGHSRSGAHGRIARGRAREGCQVELERRRQDESVLCAESCVKQPKGSRYRDVYDQGRGEYREAVHDRPCPRCGPAGHPALQGSPLSLGHQHLLIRVGQDSVGKARGGLRSGALANPCRVKSASPRRTSQPTQNFALHALQQPADAGRGLLLRARSTRLHLRSRLSFAATV